MSIFGMERLYGQGMSSSAVEVGENSQGGRRWTGSLGRIG